MPETKTRGKSGFMIEGCPMEINDGLIDGNAMLDFLQRGEVNPDLILRSESGVPFKSFVWDVDSDGHEGIWLSEKPWEPAKQSKTAIKRCKEFWGRQRCVNYAAMCYSMMLLVWLAINVYIGWWITKG